MSAPSAGSRRAERPCSSQSSWHGRCATSRRSQGARGGPLFPNRKGRVERTFRILAKCVISSALREMRKVALLVDRHLSHLAGESEKKGCRRITKGAYDGNLPISKDPPTPSPRRP